MKRHTTVGAQTLAAALEQSPKAVYLRVAKEIAESHHERWDGDGYPHRLAGERIPLTARIVAVADVYDALRSQRTYKPAFGHEKARGIILEGAGTQFDPAVVDAFVRIERRFIEIHQKFNDPIAQAA